MKYSKAINKVGIAVAVFAVAACTAFGQGVVIFFNTSTTLVRTNSLGTGGTAGNTSPDLNGFAYGLFIAPSTVTSLSPEDLLTATWTFTGLYATNTAASSGGRLNGGNMVAVPGWEDTTNSFAVAGWSANIGSLDWSSVAAQLAGASLTNGLWSGPNWLPASAGGFFGVSSVGMGWASRLQAPQPIFGPPQATGPPIGTGFDLYGVNIPEPSAWALAVAGAATGIGLRRRIRRTS